jgi:hypothetical protein
VQCQNTNSFYPQNTSCSCTSGSGSCYSSKQIQYSLIEVQYCTNYDTGYYNCTNGGYTAIGVSYGCGDQGYDTWGVVVCASAYTGFAIADILVILGTGGIGAVLALIGTGSGSIAACRWCKLHVCGPYPGDKGTVISNYTQVTVADSCP